MDVETVKVEVESESCCVCTWEGEELYSIDEYDADGPPSQPPLRTMLLHLNNNKTIPNGRLCSNCIRKTIEGYNFSKMLSSTGPPPLSEKIRALRKRLHELTQKIDVFIVVGGGGANGTYSEEDIIMVEKDTLAAATRADEAALTKATNTRGDSGYQCNHCPAFFTKATEYRDHKATHSGTEPLVCWDCGEQFPAGADAALEEHAQAHHTDDSLVCYICHTSFENYTELREHEELCPSACPVCPATFTTRGALRTHAATHPTVCGTCLRVFPTPAERAAHALHHRLSARYVCGYDGCILRFTHRSNLLSHIRKNHVSSPPPPPAATAAPPTHAPVMCDHCDRTFATLAAMRRHSRVHRNNLVQQEPNDFAETDEEGNKVEYLEMETLEDE